MIVNLHRLSPFFVLKQQKILP
jgi:hypothetical protein